MYAITSINVLFDEMFATRLDVCVYLLYDVDEMALLTPRLCNLCLASLDLTYSKIQSKRLSVLWHHCEYKK